MFNPVEMNYLVGLSLRIHLLLILPMHQKTINTYSNESIARLKMEIHQQLILVKDIKSGLPQRLAEHVLHCVLKNCELIIFTDSGAWASQLRFYNNDIILLVKIKQPNPVNKILIKVLNHYTPGPRYAKKNSKIPSATVITAIYQQSQNIKHNEIKDALIKLSATLARLQNR